jgi:iron complex outermembrane receptor protein
MRKFTFGRPLVSASLGALAVCLAMPTMAQDADDADESEDRIIVTGTLLRGIAPVGTNVVAVSEEDVIATGAASTNDLLATVPQMTNFNTIPNGGSNFGQPTVRTDLRGLGGAGGSTTLVLLNGHRLVGQGVLQTFVDPQIIPTGIIQRVEVIPDGGSSIYGSDAIGGVVNFITKTRFDGIEAAARYGFADGYDTVDANVTAGTTWGSGGAAISYSYAWHNEILGIERDYATQDHRGFGGNDNRILNCAPGNIQVDHDSNPATPRVNYPMPSFAGDPNRCDASDYASIYPRESRHSVFAALDQDLSASTVAKLTAYYSRRDTENYANGRVGNGAITNANPYFIPGPVGGETGYNVAISFAPVFGNSTIQPQRFDSWGFTPTLDIALSDEWNLTVLGNYGHSWNNTIEYGINGGNLAAALAGTTTATALNPYDVTQTNDAVLDSLLDQRSYSAAKQDIGELRVVADGTLMSLPGGDVKLALGSEFHWERIAADIEFGSSTAPFTNSAEGDRTVMSMFGEIFVPVVEMLDLTGSVRYDYYSDVGDTINPKVGFTLRPVDGLSIRGNYGTSFHAPSLADTVGAVDARLSHGFFFPGTGGRYAIWISGGSETLQPETATTWSIGADYTPSFFRSLRVSATYYNIDFTDIIGTNFGAFFAGAPAYANPENFPYFILDPTIAEVNAFGGAGLGVDTWPSLQSLYDTFGTPFAVLDARRYNRGRLLQDGIDFDVSLNHPTDFGSINARFGGTYTLTRKTSATNNGIYVDQLENGTGQFNFVASLGATVGPVTARAQWAQRDGYPVLFNPLQSEVSSYSLVDLYFAYDLGSIAYAESVELTLNIDNVFDEDPPFVTSGNGYGNGSTFGRLVQVGIRTRF